MGGHAPGAPPLDPPMAKVMFLHLSVSHFVHRRGLHPGAWSASRGVVCIQGGGLHPGGSVLWGEGSQTSPTSDTMGYAQRTGGTHPAGMHIC